MKPIKRHFNRNIITNELQEIVSVQAEKENLIRMMKSKLGKASSNVLEVSRINVLEDGCIEFNCKTLWDCDTVCENDKIIIDPDDERTQGSCLRGMTSIWVADARIYNDGHTEYDDITQRKIDEEPDRYYFAFITNGEDEHGEYQEYYVVDLKYHLPIEKHYYPSFMF